MKGVVMNQGRTAVYRVIGCLSRDWFVVSI